MTHLKDPMADPEALSMIGPTIGIGIGRAGDKASDWETVPIHLFLNEAVEISPASLIVAIDDRDIGILCDGGGPDIVQGSLTPIRLPVSACDQVVVLLLQANDRRKDRWRRTGGRPSGHGCGIVFVGCEAILVTIRCLFGYHAVEAAICLEPLQLIDDGSIGSVERSFAEGLSYVGKRHGGG